MSPASPLDHRLPALSWRSRANPTPPARHGLARLAIAYYLGLIPALALTLLALHVARVCGAAPDLASTISFFVLTWTIYLLDRRIDSPEDETAGAPQNAAAFAHVHRRRIDGLLAALALVQLGLFAVQPRLALCWVAGLTIAGLYSLPIPGFRSRVKDVPYAKSFYFTLVVMVTVFLFFDCLPADGAAVVACGLFALVLQLANAIYDLKDLDGDRAAGIRTLAGDLGNRRFLILSQGLVLLGMVAAAGLPAAASVGLLATFAAFLAGFFFLHRRPFDLAMCVYFDLAMCVGLALGLLIA